MKKTIQFILTALILTVAAKSIYFYGFTPLDVASPAPFVGNYQARQVGIYTHVFSAVVALLLGPLQFLPRLRQGHRRQRPRRPLSGYRS